MDVSVVVRELAAAPQLGRQLSGEGVHPLAPGRPPRNPANQAFPCDPANQAFVVWPPLTDANVKSLSTGASAGVHAGTWCVRGGGSGVKYTDLFLLDLTPHHLLCFKKS